MEQLLIRGWLWIIAGAIAIGCGGVFATLGWNQINHHTQIKTLITAIFREWEINNALITKEDLFNSTDDNVIGSHRLYPRFKISASNNILTSGLFSSSNPKNRNLLLTLADYKETLEDINARLGVSDNYVISTEDLSAIARHRLHIKSSQGFRSLLEQHKVMGDFLRKEYPWITNETFL